MPVINQLNQLHPGTGSLLALPPPPAPFLPSHRAQCRKDYGVRFVYWKLGATELPAADAGMAFVVADDVLLPERAGQKVRHDPYARG